MTLTLIRPDDWHLHLRDGSVLASLLPHTVRRFARAIIMPNLKPPVTTTDEARAYRDRILEALPLDATFEPLMTIFLTESMLPAEIARAKESGIVHGVKYYPAGATTHAASGVTDPKHCYPVFAEMEKRGMPLLVHGEVTDPKVDVFDREAVFLERHLDPIIRAFPNLRIVLEHITTRDAVDFVRQGSKNLAATITAHHLLLNRNAIFEGGLRPHNYCLPLLKREQHRLALIEAATSGNPKYFLGTDSAPHLRHAKESACGCAGIYSAHAAIELYAEAFEQAGAIDRLESFASFHGADFYQLPRNRETVTLVRESWQVPGEYNIDGNALVPMRAGGAIAWKIAEGTPSF
ncbi:MAG: dihydroorotase [Fibrobacterota bacterium]|nr:dihydroorotase [Fibrobacterota bacterium]